MKETLKKIIKVSIFFIIVGLPFLTITQIIGMNTFLDSFENPESYVCFKDNGDWLGTKTKESEYIIIQKSSHPDLLIEESDTILYYTSKGNIFCSEISCIKNRGSITSYYAKNNNEPIYKSQIIGKIISVVDDNIWNTISIKIWETSIYNLNIRALVAD